MDGLPTSPDEIDAAELGRLLEPRHPGVRVDEVEVGARTELTNSHAHLRVRYVEAAGAPTELFLKLLPSDAGRREAIARTGMGPREVRFYSALAPTVGMRVPQIHAAFEDEVDGSFLLLMEDLAATGCTTSNGTVGLTPDAAAQALSDLAELHVRFEDPARRRAEAAWISVTGTSDYGAVLLQQGLDQHRDRLTPTFAELSELYIERLADLHALWQEGPHTVIHGDAHIGNLFDDHGRTGFLDWGIIHLGTPIRDVSYLLTMALDVEDRRKHERELWRHYLAARSALGGAAIGFDDAWRGHRIHTAYTVPACCQIVTFPKHATEARRIFSQAFLARAEAALEDLEVRAALRECDL